jgi:CheY-like chemotaxis protein
MTTPIIPAKRILVVDDDPLVCDSVRMMLAHDGHAVEMALSGQEALQRFVKGKFDLVLIDYAMPVMRGDELAVAIRAQAPDQPIAMITAHAELMESPANPLAGTVFVIAKPFRLEELREVIDKLWPKE